MCIVEAEAFHAATECAAHKIATIAGREIRTVMMRMIKTMKKQMTEEQKAAKVSRNRKYRERKRRSMNVPEDENIKSKKCGFAENVYWNKYTYALASVVSKACNAFFNRRGIPYQYAHHVDKAQFNLGK